MYLEHFGLREEPFQLTPDPAFLFLSRSHARAKAYMEFAVLRRDGFVVITGDIGSGKTILLRSVLSELGDDVQVVRVFQTQLDEVDLLRVVLSQLGFKPFQAPKVELLDTLNRHLEALHAQGRRVLLVIDEAQHLGFRVLEELRLLTGLETDKEKLINIILVGQRELDDLLDSPEMEQLRQRIRLRYDLGPLSDEEVRRYVAHRLQVAGGDADRLFPEEVFAEIYRYTGGVPRLINTLCDTALLTAYVNQSAQVTAALLKETIEELRWVPYASRMHTSAMLVAGEADGGDWSEYGRLIVSRDERTVGEIPLNRRFLTLGRHGSNDVRIPGRLVSRHHAQVTTLGRNSFLVDLNSLNGTFVNGRAIRQALLREGDSIAIGDYILRYVAPTGLDSAPARDAQPRPEQEHDTAENLEVVKPAEEGEDLDFELADQPP